MVSSDDLAEQQLFAEIHASAKKVQHQSYEPPSTSAVQSAHLLNAARLNRRTVPAASSSSTLITSNQSRPSDPVKPKGTIRSDSAGKLKPVSLFHNDPVKQPHRDHARRGDPFDLGFSSPEKPTTNPPVTRQKPSKSKKLVQRELSPQLEASAPLPGVPDRNGMQEETRTDLPSHSGPKTPRTRKQISRDTAYKRDHSEVAEERPQGRKRRAMHQPSTSGQPTKSSKRQTAPVRKEAMLEGTQSKNGDRQRPAGGMHPQMINSSPNPTKRETRATNAKTVQSRPDPMDASSAQIESTYDDAALPDKASSEREAANALIMQSEVEEPQEPPQSAQKSPEPVPESPKPQSSKPRKVKLLKSSKVNNGLNIPSDEEEGTSEHPRNDGVSEQDNVAAGTRQSKRHKGSKPADVVAGSWSSTLPLHLQYQPQELPAKRPRGRPPKSSTSVGKGNDSLDRDDGDDKSTDLAQRTRSGTKPTESVAVVLAKAARLQSDASGSDSRQNNTDNARSPTDMLDELDEESGEEDVDHAAPEVSDLSRQVDEDDEDESDDESSYNPHNPDSTQFYLHEALVEVFKFLDPRGRSGDCRTEDAIAVKQACQKALDILADPDATLEDVAVPTKLLLMRLSEYGENSTKEQHKSLKVDAYAYLFQYVVGYLKSLHRWLKRRHGHYQSSLKAMSIIAPLVSAIVSLKDKIAHWQAKLPIRYKGDRIIKDVDTNLIVPLRRLSAGYITALYILKDDAKKELEREALARKRHEQKQQKLRQQEMEAVRNHRLNRWIELHVCRLRVEPDPRLRQSLRMDQDVFDKKMARLTDNAIQVREMHEVHEERDANGIPFSRVDLFKKRLVPPASPRLAELEKEWTDEQMWALVEGLQKFMGPHVFQKIFNRYCGSDEPLRFFGVPEITAKAAEVRMLLLRRYEKQEWSDVPEWILLIPVLP